MATDTLIISNRGDMHTYIGSGVAGDYSTPDEAAIADYLVDEGHARGYAYGDDWAPWFDRMSEHTWNEMVSQALAVAS
jgi:hypothetical protein